MSSAPPDPPATLIQAASLGEGWEDSIRALVGVRRPLLEGTVGGPYVEGRNFIIAVDSATASPQVSKSYRYPMLLTALDGDTGVIPDEIREVRDRLESWTCGSVVANQMEGVVATLERNLRSRRAVMSLWNPAVDPSAYNAICPVTVQAFVRESHDEEYLNLTVIVRSSDAWTAAMADMWFFSQVQVSLASAIGAPVGSYVHHAVSYHMYEHDIPAGRALLVRG